MIGGQKLVPKGDTRNPDGRFLVACQFFLFFVLLATTDWNDLSPLSLLLFLPPLFLGGWAILILRPGRFNVRPTIKDGATLITHGPYRVIRHPMYTSLLLSGLGLLFITWSWLRLAALLALGLVLLLKLRLEERLLRQHFSGYSSYQKRSSRLLPWY